MYRILIVLGVVLGLHACDNQTPDYYYTKGGLKYEYHDIVEDGETPAVGDYLTVYIKYKTSDGRVIYDSEKSTYNGNKSYTWVNQVLTEELRKGLLS